MSNELIITVGIFLLTQAISYGIQRGRSNEFERRLQHAEDESAKQNDLIHSLRDVYVSYQHFNEIMASIRETQRELRDGMTKIIELLTKTGI